MGVGNSGSRFGAIVIVLLTTAALCAAVVVGEAGAAKLVGKDGRIYACYKAKGKAKGAVRLVPKKARCKKGQKKISWSVAGPAGESGQGGESGSNGEGGSGGESGSNGVTAKGLENKVQALTTKLTSLESVLKGITNTELLGALGKLQGISGSQLQETVASLTKVNALCSQASKLTSQSTALGEAIGGLKLITGGLPGLGLEKLAPIPTPLSTFACP